MMKIYVLGEIFDKNIFRGNIFVENIFVEIFFSYSSPI